MPVVSTANDIISKQKQGLADLLAKCTYWQQIGGANYGESGAAQRIYFDGIDLDSPPETDEYGISNFQQLRPFAHVFMAEQRGLSLIQSSFNSFDASGSLFLKFEIPVDSRVAQKYAEAKRRVELDVGRICCSGDTDNPGLTELSGIDGNFEFSELHVDDIRRTPPEERAVIGDAFAVYLEILWGVQPR